MHYVYDGRSKRYPRQPVLPDLSTREVLGTDVGSALGRRMIAVDPQKKATLLKKSWPIVFVGCQQSPPRWPLNFHRTADIRGHPTEYP